MTAQELNHDSDTPKENKRDDKAILARFLFTVLFVVIGWLSLWVLAAIVVIQFGFMIFDGGKNHRLNQFAGQLIDFQKQLLKYIAMQNDEKPFPFNEWPQKTTQETD
ncbi:MAG: DUF4389 domain-containing protein [Proteobacteria bacterium]|nr:MAG: DUF4389 domain-containing protein [Pseudomonadota bacterium]